MSVSHPLRTLSGGVRFRPVADIRAECDHLVMKALLPFALLLIGAAPSDHDRRYLLSLGRIPVGDTESIEAFSIRTWGVRFVAVCHIPRGWRVKAGSSATPNGEVSGDGSQGATWFRRSSPKELQQLVLVTLSGPVQRETVGSEDNGVPATFIGTVTLSTDDGKVQRVLTYRNVTLTPSHRCPSR